MPDRRMKPRGKCVKVALTVNQSVQLTEIDLELALEDTLRGICEENNIAYARGAFALRIQDARRELDTEYVTEENKSELKHGRQLRLARAPAERASGLVDALHKSGDAESSLRSLRNLALASKDAVVLRELSKRNALQHLRVFASVRQLSPEEYHRHYRIVRQFLARGYVQQLCDDEVAQLIELIAGDRKVTSDLLSVAFEVLILLRRRGKLRWPLKLLRKLTPYVRLYEEPKLQERALHFINSLYVHASDAEERRAIRDFMKSSIMITYINKYVIRENLPDATKHQLYLYQRIILRKYARQLEAINLDEDEILENLEYVIANIGLVNQVRSAFATSSFDSDGNRKSGSSRDGDRAQQILRTLRTILFPNARRRTASFAAPGDAERAKRRERFTSQDDDDDDDDEREFVSRIEERGFARRQRSVDSATDANVDDDDDGDDDVAGEGAADAVFRGGRGDYRATTEVPALARDNIYYFVVNDFRGFERLLLLHRSHVRSILRASIGVTSLLCDVFEIRGESEADAAVGRFVPLCFLYYDRFIERMFCIAFKLFHETRREMRLDIDSDECGVILKTVEDKLRTALESEPVEFVELEERLRELTLDVVARRRKELIEREIARQLTSEPAFVELREVLAPEMTNRIREKRLRFMESGEHVPQFDHKGQRIPGKKWFVRVPRTRDRLVIEECVGSECNGRHRIAENVSACDITDVEHGAKSNFHKEVYFNLYTERDMFFRQGTRQQEPDFGYPVSVKLRNLSYVDFCAESESSMDQWVDGLNVLTGEKMSSKAFKDELEYLLDIELMTRLAEVEDVRIPRKAPPVPPPPSDYDFATP